MHPNHKLIWKYNIFIPTVFNPLSFNPTKWSNTLKQFVLNCLRVFDHFAVLALKVLIASELEALIKMSSTADISLGIFRFL